MSTSTSLNRLASSSRCLYVAKSPFCNITSSHLQTHFRSYATEHTPIPPVSRSVATPSLASRLRKSTKKKSRPRPLAKGPTLAYPPSPVDIPQRGSNKPWNKHGGGMKSHLRATSPAPKPNKPVKVLPRVAKTPAPVVIRTVHRIPSLKTMSVQEFARKKQHEESTLGPGFVPETWLDVLNQSESSGKSAPPHVMPLTDEVEGVIGSHLPGLVDVAPVSEHLPVATLAHGLDRVLFNPGVHWLQDPRSHVYNFTPWLEKIPKVNDFAFEKLTGFISSSRDEDLRALAKQEKKKFAGSTSSMSGMLSHIYFLISQHKDVELTTLSQHFVLENPTFTAGQRMPSSVSLVYKDGVYAIDSLGSELDDPDKNVLTWLGTLLENFLTKTPAEFNKFLRAESEPSNEGEPKPLREAFRFAKSDKMVMRSQLDCQDKRLPGTGVFDIKTRAVISIRMDILNYEENAGYMIKSQYGILESFEREYYDLIRAAFLKYSFQVRIGNMDGVMVTYHNTERIFGFQYISLDEMDERIYGPIPGIGEKVFNKSVTVLEAILEEATKCYPEQSVVCVFETRRPGKIMDVFVQPSEWHGEGKKPATQLLVELTHELDGRVVKPHEALKSTSEEWTMKYKISKAALPAEVVLANLNGAEYRKTRSFVLPSNVKPEDAQEYWEKLSFNPKLEISTKEFKPSNFTVADSGIEKYRELSREGRELYKELQRRQEGKPKIVLGRGVHEEEESLFFKEPHPSTPSEPDIKTTEQAEKTSKPESESETAKI